MVRKKHLEWTTGTYSCIVSRVKTQLMHCNPNLHRVVNPVLKRASLVATMICPLEMLTLTDHWKIPTNQKSNYS